MTVRQLIMSHRSLKYRAPRVTPTTMVTSRPLCMPCRPSAAPWTAPHTPPKATTHAPPLPAASPFVVVLDDLLGGTAVTMKKMLETAFLGINVFANYPPSLLFYNAGVLDHHQLFL